MDVTISANYSDRPYALRMRIYTIENNVGGNYSRYRGDRYAISLTSGTGSWAYDCRVYESWIAGYYLGGCYGLDFRPNFFGKTIGLGSYDTGAVYHDGNGNLNFTSRIRVYNVPVFGSADTGDVWMSGDRLPMAPGAPGTPTVSNLTPTSLTLSWTAAPRGRADITNYQWQMSVVSNFTSQVAAPVLGNVLSDSTTNDATLSPGNTYYVRVRALNADGWGAWSGTRQFTTLPAAPPGFSVLPNISGTGATVSLTPPGGTTGVTKYSVQYRLSGGTATTVENPTSPIVVSGLTPGGEYEWRASAWFGTYQSPWSAWLAETQPQPNTNPGSYFDGATAPRDDLTFSWSGTVNNSTSLASGVTPLAWQDGLASAGRATIQRVTGGLFGTYSARFNWYRDAVTPPVEGDNMLTIGRAEVEEGATYVGSVYVNPGRTTRLVASIDWVDAGVTGSVGVSIGEGTICPAGEWTRLIVTGQAPPLAALAWVNVWAEDGAGYEPFLGGDTILFDGAMVSLGTLYPWFSGDTPDTPEFNYAWEGVANDSVSARNELAPTFVDPLADPDCPPLPAPPSLPTIPSECIDEIGTWRRYTIQLGGGAVRKFTASLPTLVLNTGASAERQVRIRYYPNPDSVAPELIDMSAWEAEQIITYIPPMSTVTLDGVSQLVWAEVNGGETIAAERLLYGTNGMPATWPVLTCGYGYVITLDVPLDAPSGNLTTELLITQRM